jgi:DNA-binding transcriptional MerR regulator
MDDQTNTYNLKAVVMETGLKPVTLRAWERRYGLPEPKRTSGKHRLYSQRDIDMLKWMLARQKEGVSISQAVSIWRGLEADGQDPLTTGSPVSGITSAATLPSGIGEQLADLRQTWVEACLAFDEARIEQVMTEAFSRFPSEVICLELLQKGLGDMGSGWYQGNVTVQQEHFASAQAMRRLEMLVAAQPPATRAERILVGCAPKDTHTFSSLLLTFLLRRYGWDVIYLGADVPTAHLDETIRITKPALVIFTAQQLFTAVTLLDIVRILESQHIPFAYGGLVFNLIPELVEHIPGYFLGATIADAPRQVQRIFANDLEPIRPPALPLIYQEISQLFDQRRAVIEAAVWDNLASTDLPAIFLAEINGYFGRDISAALKFGRIEVLDENLSWLLALIDNHGWPQAWLDLYMRAYYQAVRATLPGENNPVVQWLHHQVEA